MSTSRKLIKTASFTGKAKRDGALSLFIVFLLGFNSQAYAASADIRTLATGELKEAISLKSAPTWVEHAATIAPITIEQQPKNEDTETRLTLSLEPFKARGITAMNDLKEFPLDHYGETYLYSLRMTSQKTAPLWQDLHYAYFGALAFSQQDGQLPFSSSAQSGSIRLHHFFLEAGVSFSKYWKTPIPIWSELSFGGGQMTLIQSSHLSQARYSEDQWFFSWMLALNYDLNSAWSFGLGVHDRRLLSETEHILSPATLWSARLYWRL